MPRLAGQGAGHCLKWCSKRGGIEDKIAMTVIPIICCGVLCDVHSYSTDFQGSRHAALCQAVWQALADRPRGDQWSVLID